MSDLIERQAVLKICRRYWHPTFNPIMEEVEKLPSAQKKGKWIDKGVEYNIRWTCSECGRRDTHVYNYCPDCGAKMEVRDD